MWRKQANRQLIVILIVIAVSALTMSMTLAKDKKKPTKTPTATEAVQQSANNAQSDASASPTDDPTSATPTDDPTSATPSPTTDTPTPDPTTATAAPTEAPTTATHTTPSQPQTDALTVSKAEPSQVTAGTGGNLSISGSGFTDNTTVRLVGYGYLTVSLINSGALTAALPTTLAKGTYGIEVSDPDNGTATAATKLKVVSPPSTEVATETKTPTPGQPTLIIGSFSANPSSIYPGGATQLTFTVQNVGNRTGKGVAVALGQTTFAPANGQSSATLPDLDPGASAGVTLTVTAPMDAAEGPVSIPVVITSRDSEGGSYSNDATLSVIILAKQAKQAQLVLNGYRVSPASAAPGDTVSVQALLTNTGNDTASQVLLQLDTTSDVLIPAGQSNSFAVGDMAPGVTVPLTMSFTVAGDAKTGAQAQTFDVAYQQDGAAQQTTVSVSVDVLDAPTEVPQIVLQSYQITPNSAYPGDQVMIQAVLTNSGAAEAKQVMIALDDTTKTLIPAGAGSSFPVGDMTPGDTVTVQMPLIVAGDATSGAQAQTFTISYLQNGTSETQPASVSLQVNPTVEKAPMVLLQSYDVGQTDPLTPGQQFTYKMTLQNAGNADASNLLLSFGTVSTNNNSSNSSGSDTTGSDTTNTTTDSNASDTFSTLDAGSTVLIGTLGAGQTKSLNQSFIVASDATSGVHDLPVTLQYLLPDGTQKQQSLSANLLVVDPPRLRVVEVTTLSDPLTMGTSYPVSLKLSNLGTADAEVTQMRVSGTNIKVTSGATNILDPLQSDDDVSKSATIQPQASGTYTIKVDVDYLDDLNRTETYTTTFTGNVNEAQARTFVRPTTNQQSQTPDNNDLIGRLLLGFLGLGG